MDNFIENAKVMAKGQVTIPKAVRDLMGIAPGDRVSFLVNQGKVQIINSKDYLLAYEENMIKEESRGEEDES
ncbi:AbrB/MazE/SpoVT family DNA-binding domain-containing protein [Facklamia sp. P12934]|uniref:AbrB/MazE/SpoVT family DNA-binding domain-containing protein n=1 Tax=unclassified Facklamia TaxID=2622293 RepID=UPI003D17362C